MSFAYYPCRSKRNSRVTGVVQQDNTRTATQATVDVDRGTRSGTNVSEYAAVVSPSSLSSQGHTDASDDPFSMVPAVLYMKTADGDYAYVSNPQRRISEQQYKSLCEKSSRTMDDSTMELLCDGGDGVCRLSAPAQVSLSSPGGTNSVSSSNTNGSDSSSPSGSSKSADMSTGVCTEACDTVSLSAPHRNPRGDSESIHHQRGTGGDIVKNKDGDADGALLSKTSHMRAYSQLLLPVRRVDHGEFVRLAATARASNVYVDPMTGAPFVVDQGTRTYSKTASTREYSADDVNAQYVDRFGRPMNKNI